MDKELDELRDDIRRTLQAINDNLLELNDYLARLRAETRHALTQVPAGEFVPTADEPTPDPRRPYLAGRQPRRDGDSFGSVLPSPTVGGTHGETSPVTGQQRRRAEGEEKT